MTERSLPAAKFLNVNGLRLRFLEWGRPDAPPVVCVHGYTSSAEAFNALARCIQDRAHVIAMDVRGHGDSAWSPGGAYQYAEQAGDLAALVDKLGFERFVLVGTSMGGIIATAYAAQHAERLRGLIINDIGPDVETGSSRITGLVGSRPESFASLDEAMAYRREISPITAARPIEDQEETARGVLRQQPDGRWAWKMDPAYVEQRVTRGAPARPQLWPALEKLRCPTVVIWGTESDVLSEAQAKRMAAALPKGELVAVPGVGHAPTLVEPAALAAIERLLGEVRDTP
jgi:pimeloyl-ACP methyl ester carboxylesterase